ncbi:MAG: hypothetical protein V4653_14005 [Pseudomonadota bacterium]
MNGSQRSVGLLRQRGDDTHAKVGYPGMFFDLVFVFGLWSVAMVIESASPLAFFVSPLVLGMAATAPLILVAAWEYLSLEKVRA